MAPARRVYHKPVCRNPRFVRGGFDSLNLVLATGALACIEFLIFTYICEPGHMPFPTGIRIEYRSAINIF